MNLRRVLRLEQLVGQIDRRKHRRVAAADLGVRQLGHALIHDASDLLHVGGVLVGDEGILLARNRHCHFVCHRVTLLYFLTATRRGAWLRR